MNVGNLPSSPTLWQTIEEQQELIRELGNKNAIYVQHSWGPDNKLFSSCMKDILLQSSPDCILQDPWCQF